MTAQTIETPDAPEAPPVEQATPQPEGWAKVKGGRRPHYFRDGNTICAADYEVPGGQLEQRGTAEGDCAGCAKRAPAAPDTPAPVVEQTAAGAGQGLLPSPRRQCGDHSPHGRHTWPGVLEDWNCAGIEQHDDQVTDERAQLLAIHAIVVQGGFSTAEIEAERAREAIALGLHIDWDQIQAEIVAVVAPSSPEVDVPPATREVDAEPGTRLGELVEQYADLKAAADEAAERFKACTDGIKAELANLDDQAKRFFVRSLYGPPLALTHSETTRFDSKRFKAEHPETYDDYVKTGESWTLKVVSTGGGE